MSTPLLTIANLLMDEARKAGATASRVSVSQGENISVSVCNGADEGAEMNNGISVALRVFIGQNSFAATTSALGEQELRAFARRAVQLCIAPDPYAGLPDAQDYAQNPQAQLAALDLYDAYWPDAATLTDMARELDTIVMAHPDVSNTEGSSVSAGSSYRGSAERNG